MPDVIDPVIRPLVNDLLTSLSRQDQPYEEMMKAWRTSCPRLPVWEEVNDRGFVVRDNRDGERIIRITKHGTEYLLAQA